MHATYLSSNHFLIRLKELESVQTKSIIKQKNILKKTSFKRANTKIKAKEKLGLVQLQI